VTRDPRIGPSIRSHERATRLLPAADAVVSQPIEVALEIGRKRTFATALESPGWCRPGTDEDGALEALLAYAPRYQAALEGAVRGFRPPRSVSSFEVADRIRGNAGTDFGAPGAPPKDDSRPASARDLARLERILRACWAAFDRASASAEGIELRKGPRGGGRHLAKIRAHVLESDAAYLGVLGGWAALGTGHDEIREAFIEALAARARGELPDVGPRGGKRRSPRFAVRYAAWHSLDHAWEIEDRATN